MKAEGIWPAKSSVNKGDQAQRRLDSTAVTGAQGSSSCDAGEKNSTAVNGPQGASGTDAGGQNSTSGNGSGTGADEQESTAGDEPMAKDEGVYDDGYYCFDAAETDVQTTSHSVSSYQVICCKYFGDL